MHFLPPKKLATHSKREGMRSRIENQEGEECYSLDTIHTCTFKLLSAYYVHTFEDLYAYDGRHSMCY